MSAQTDHAPSADLATQEQHRQPAPITTEIRRSASEYALALGGQAMAERFVRIAVTALGRNADLANCTRETILGGLMTCAQLHLEPNDPRGQAFLIPFRNNKEGTLEAQLVIGYKGLVDLAYRSGQIKTLAAEAVHENDHFIEQRWPRKLEHRAAQGDRGDVVRYYAAVEYKDGGIDFAVMTVEEVEKHRDLYSKAWQKRPDSPWKTAPDEMAKKTCVRKLAKFMPLSVEDLRPMAAALNVDGQAIRRHEAGSVDALLTREAVAIEAPDVTAPPTRVTAAEINDEPATARAPDAVIDGNGEEVTQAPSAPTVKTLQRLNILIQEGGITDRDKRIEYLRFMTGRDEIASSKDLTKIEAAKLISDLENEAKARSEQGGEP